jgi:LPXTG-site transpeptidase (sortase) family protein
MKLKNYFKLPVVVGILVILLPVLIISFLILYLPSKGFIYSYNSMGVLYPAGLPVRLTIPKIKVDASIEYVGVTAKGEMGVPKGPKDVAWFDIGTRPGNIGSAVIAGHYGTWINGEGSVFDNLNKLVRGDKIYVEDEKGMISTFVVRESRSYNPNADASEVFGLADGKSHLNLVTCEGIWNEVSQTYSQRLVVFADKQ